MASFNLTPAYLKALGKKSVGKRRGRFDSWGEQYLFAKTCCGVVELTELPNFEDAVEKFLDENNACTDQQARQQQEKMIAKTVNYVVSKADYNCVVYYGVDKDIIQILKRFGFKEKGSFVNPSTRNRVHILMNVAT